MKSATTVDASLMLLYYLRTALQMHLSANLAEKREFSQVNKLNHSVVTTLVTAAIFAGISVMPAKADLIGQIVDASINNPEMSTVNTDLGTQTITTGGETFNFAHLLLATVFGDHIVLTSGDVNLTGADFNGWEVSEVGGSPYTITSVTIDPATTLTGFTASDVTFTATQVFLNLQGLSIHSSDLVVVDINADSAGAPEPSTFCLMGLGLLSAVFIGAYRRRLKLLTR